MSNLPDDSIEEIMLWLPVKSLLRFRCACKLLCAVIASKCFINSHLKRCSKYGIHRKLICQVHTHVDNDAYGRKFHTIDINDGYKEEFFISELVRSSIYHLYGSYCNGLFLTVLTRGYKLSIWNPSTRQYKKLPDFPVKCSHAVVWRFGLGYDSIDDDYKVVVMIYMSYSDIPKVWIFGLKSSCWRKLGDFPYAEYKHVQVGGNGDCFTDGALHFICLHIDWKSHIVVAFDVAKETFSEVLEPVYHNQPSKNYEIKLHAVTGCLFISLYDYETRQNDLYQRRKEGVEFTWTKLYSVAAQQISQRKFFYIRNGKLLEYSKERGEILFEYGKLFSFDIKEKSLELIKIENVNALHCVFYIESLVPVGC